MKHTTVGTGPAFYVTSKRIEKGGLVVDERWVALCDICPWATVVDDLQAAVDEVHAHRFGHGVGEPA